MIPIAPNAPDLIKGILIYYEIIFYIMATEAAELVANADIGAAAATKRCSKCGLVKPREAFARNIGKGDGLQTHCKECNRKYRENNKERISKINREWRIKNREHHSKQRHGYYENNKEGILQYLHEYRKKNREVLLQKSREDYCDNRDKYINQARRYRERNKEIIAKRRREHYEQNREIILKRSRGYRERNKENCLRRSREYLKTPNGKLADKRHRHKRRSLEKTTEKMLTTNQWCKILEQQKNRCNFCHRKFTKMRPPTADHIIPLSKGGRLTFENTQALCASCNSSKSNKLHPHFIQVWLEKL